MTSDIGGRSLIQIGLQIPRWRTIWRQSKGMAVSQAFIFHFKWNRLLHVAVCQLLFWAFLLTITALTFCCYAWFQSSFSKSNLCTLFYCEYLVNGGRWGNFFYFNKDEYDISIGVRLWHFDRILTFKIGHFVTCVFILMSN